MTPQCQYTLRRPLWLLIARPLSHTRLVPKWETRESSEPPLVEFTTSHWNFFLEPPIMMDSHKKGRICHANCDVVYSYCVPPLVIIWVLPFLISKNEKCIMHIVVMSKVIAYLSQSLYECFHSWLAKCKLGHLILTLTLLAKEQKSSSKIKFSIYFGQICILQTIFFNFLILFQAKRRPKKNYFGTSPHCGFLTCICGSAGLVKEFWSEPQDVCHMGCLSTTHGILIYIQCIKLLRFASQVRL